MERASLAGRRVLVTGAAGQLGGYLLPALRRAGAVPVALAHHPGEGVDLVADIADPAQVAAAFAGARPEIVIHGAAWTDVDGARVVAEAARDASAHLVAVSTDFVFSGLGGAPYAEDAPTDPVSEYGRTKRDGELAVLAADPSFAVARTAWLYGGKGKHFPRTVLSVVLARGGIEVVDDEAGSPTFAGDLAEALVALAAARGAGVFHLANAGRASRYGFAREIVRLAGLPESAVMPTTTEAFLAKYPLPARRPADSELRNVRAAALGIALRPWQDAASAYVPRLAAELGIGGAG